MAASQEESNHDACLQPIATALGQEPLPTQDLMHLQRTDLLLQPTTKQWTCILASKQPDTTTITQEQLAQEVKGIYAGLVMVEAKCINTDGQNAANPDEPERLGAEQWQALIALHRTLLYEHHDFLMATQHPSANAALRGLATKYCMPSHVWKHGIHAMMEVIRQRRPESQEYMLASINLAYQMMELLYETTSSFTDVWIDCLGDMARNRYRTAIEEGKNSHATWGDVAGRWRTTASDRNPAVERMYLRRLSRCKSRSTQARSLAAAECLLPENDSTPEPLAPEVAVRVCNPPDSNAHCKGGFATGPSLDPDDCRGTHALLHLATRRPRGTMQTNSQQILTNIRGTLGRMAKNYQAVVLAVLAAHLPVASAVALPIPGQKTLPQTSTSGILVGLIEDYPALIFVPFLGVGFLVSFPSYHQEATKFPYKRSLFALVAALCQCAHSAEEEPYAATTATFYGAYVMFFLPMLTKICRFLQRPRAYMVSWTVSSLAAMVLLACIKNDMKETVRWLSAYAPLAFVCWTSVLFLFMKGIELIFGPQKEDEEHAPDSATPPNPQPLLQWGRGQVSSTRQSLSPAHVPKRKWFANSRRAKKTSSERAPTQQTVSAGCSTPRNATASALALPTRKSISPSPVPEKKVFVRFGWGKTASATAEQSFDHAPISVPTAPAASSASTAARQSQGRSADPGPSALQILDDGFADVPLDDARRG